MNNLEPTVQVSLVYTKDDEGVIDIPNFIGDWIIKNKTPIGFKTYNAKSSGFTEKRTANSFLSKHGTTNTPLMLFSKEGVVVRALYKEEHKNYDSFADAFIDKYYEALKAEVPEQYVEETFE